MKILLDSNAPWAATGYGTQGASLARRLRDAGHQVTYYVNYGLHGGVIEWEGIRCLPGTMDGYDDPIVHGHVRAFAPDLIITLFDIWVWADRPFPMPLSWLHEDEHIPRWAAWIPIDHEPLGTGNIKALGGVTYPIAMSEFGQRMMSDIGVESTFIPHGVEKDFAYTSAGRREFRRVFLIPEDAFVFGSVGLNRNYPGRKGFDRLIEAFSKLEDKSTYLYLHTQPESQVGSIDLNQVVEFYGVKGRVLFPDPYNYIMGLSQIGMNSVYSGIDCYVQATHGEGFGLPVMEAQACGLPVIATNCTSMPEMVCPDTSMLIDPATHYLTPDIGHRFLIDIPKLTAAMADAIAIKQTDPLGYRNMRANAGKWANGWDWDKVWAEAWVPFLEQVEGDIKNQPHKKWHRGGARVFEQDGLMRKQDSAIHQAPAVKKELAMLRTLDHPNIIPVLAEGVSEDGMTWFDMPKYTTLDEIKPDDLSEEEKQRILTGLSDALNYLHGREIAHRDVHPSNVLVDDERNPYLIDFAWAHACDGDPCVDFKPWECMDKAVPSVQMGSDQRGYHTVVAYLRGIDINQKTHGLKGVPYQAIDGVGERDCQTRWDLMKPEVAGKRVLDIGTNLGWFVRKSLAEGALEAVGLDSDAAVIEAARALGDGFYHPVDLDDFDNATFGKFDVAFALSVLQHTKNPDRILQVLTHIAGTIYIEQPPRFITPYMAELLGDAEYLGESERGRPLYRVTVRAAVTA